MYQIVLPIVLPLIGTYIVSSVVLLHFPHLVHRKKNTRFRCRHISHRGGSGENLENTMTAYKHAVQTGTEMLEIDVQLTADKQVVVSHDNDLYRATGVKSLISEMKYKDLPLLRETIHVTFQPGAFCEVKNNDREMPLLEKVFSEFPDIPINIDIKYNSDELIEKTNELILKYKREHLCAWGNFSSEITNKCYKHNPNIPVLFSLRHVVSLVLMFYCGLLPFVPLKESFLEIPLPKTMLRRFGLPRTMRVLCYIADWLLISPVLFKHLEKRGIQTFLWVLNEDDEFEFAFDKCNVAGVMTDYPSKLGEYLERRKGEEKKNM